jgi:hypothetical protein
VLKCCALFAVLLFSANFSFAPVADASEHFVAADGAPAGDGSIQNPWDLRTALRQPASLHPGDTVWVRGGTYSGQFDAKLKGTADKPIVIRNYNGEHVTLEGQEHNEFVLYVVGSYTWFWGMEVTTSCTVRVIATPVCPFGVGVYGPGNKFINLVVHDTLQGFSGYNAAPDTEFYGNLSYYNGIVSPDRNHGHGMYFQNSTGSKIVSDNIVGDNADEGIQIYGSGSAALVNFSIVGNIIFNSSSWPTPHYQYNLIIAGGQTRKNITVQNNYSYYSAGAGGYAGQFGQYTKGEDMSITNNVFVNGYMPVAFFNQSGPITFDQNTIVAPADALRIISFNLWQDQDTSSYKWDNNKYFDSSQAHFYKGVTTDGSNFSGLNTSFSGWQGMTKFDAHSTYQAGAPAGNWIYVRPNKYEPKRANIVIFNWESLPAVQVDLSTVLAPGDTYTIQDAENFYGPAVETGVYSGKKISIHMKGLTKATPVGFAAPAHTAPAFGVFVVLPAEPTKASPKPAQIN